MRPPARKPGFRGWNAGGVIDPPRLIFIFILISAPPLPIQDPPFPLLPLFASQRIPPPDSRESGKIHIRRMNLRTILPRQGSQMGIGGEISRHPHLPNFPQQLFHMPPARRDGTNKPGTEPRDNTVATLRRRQRPVQHPRGSAQTQKSQHHRHRNSHVFRSR